MSRPNPQLQLYRLTGLLFSLAVALVVSGLAGSASAVNVVSYGVQAGPNQFGPESLGGTTVYPSDLVDVETQALVFDVFPVSPAEDLDAAHLNLSNGDILFSTDTNVDQAFPGLPGGFLNGDVVLWNGTTGAVVFSEEDNVTGVNPNIDALYQFESGPNVGNLLISFAGTNNTLGGLLLRPGDVALYDLGADTATLFFDQDLIGGTQGQKDIDAFHVLPNGDILLSTRTAGGTLGGLSLAIEDLVQWDGTNASVFIDGDGLYNGTTRQLDAATVVPEPGTLLLLGAGLLGLAAHGQRRQARG